MSVSQQIPDEVKAVSRSIGFCLWVGTTEQWFGLQPILCARLSEQQRACLAFQALKSLDAENARQTAAVALHGCWASQMPVAPLFDHMDEAAFWSDMATSEELEAYCFASFTKLPRARQAAFLEHVTGRAAA